jgi:4-hydroxy-L-threonine phosphate dehydrogenase PdxA
MRDERPRIAVTMGDPSGIGPELVAAALADGVMLARCRPVVIADAGVMRAAVAAVDADLDVVAISAVHEASFQLGSLEVLTPPDGAVAEHAWGRLSAQDGRAALACLRAATSLPVDGIVSAPLNKEALHLAGMTHSDELGYLAELTGSPDATLVGILPALWTTCVTLHVPFRVVADLVSRRRVLAAISLLSDALGVSGRADRIAVAALNPHAGEGGHLGREEIDEIAPAIAAARAHGIDAIGPLPADTIFPRALAEGIGGVVCMYHDQANIARKLHDLRTQATLFLGLPVPVATTAHGTAFDLAGTGTANPGSLRAALETTIALASAGQPSAGAGTAG